MQITPFFAMFFRQGLKMHRKYQCFLDFYYDVWKIFFGFCCPQFEKHSFWLRSCHRQSGLKKVLNRSLSQSLPLAQKGGGGCGPQNVQRIANPARGGCLFHAVAQSLTKIENELGLEKAARAHRQMRAFYCCFPMSSHRRFFSTVFGLGAAEWSLGRMP